MAAVRVQPCMADEQTRTRLCPVVIPFALYDLIAYGPSALFAPLRARGPALIYCAYRALHRLACCTPLQLGGSSHTESPSKTTPGNARICLAAFNRQDHVCASDEHASMLDAPSRRQHPRRPPPKGPSAYERRMALTLSRACPSPRTDA